MRNKENNKYYYISNPKFENVHTGRFCIAPNTIMNYDKDYLFEWTNPYTKEQYKRVIPKEYIKNHMRYCVLSKWDSEHVNKEYKGYCFLITLEDILNY